MKTHTTPQRSSSRLAGISLLTAMLAAGGVLYAQQPPVAETPAPTTATAPEPAEPNPNSATGPRRTGRIPGPEKETPPTVPKAVPVAPDDPAAPRVVDSVTAPRTKKIVSHEKDANGADRFIFRTILDEEVSSNPQEAARNYEAVIAAFDSQRANAAQAIFRLGETYRKLNRLDEARVQYARILREFVDFPELARLSQMQLTQNPPALVRGGSRLAEGEGRAAAASAEERNLLLQEIKLLQMQLDQTQELVKTGGAPTSSLIPIQREILQLKRQLLRYENATDSAPASRPPTPAAPGSSDTDPTTPGPQRR